MRVGGPSLLPGRATPQSACRQSNRLAPGQRASHHSRYVMRKVQIYLLIDMGDEAMSNERREDLNRESDSPSFTLVVNPIINIMMLLIDRKIMTHNA
ncbi:hypothetical protein [Acidomonas methanolica]|uniref:hypothetical protein n=1 Tax=Acidomonas methanolica TaxID=437 RepID=UPI00130D5BF2|nr:hypothetical protein [Acidomonas methanolica]